jgi:hypothetical protein
LLRRIGAQDEPGLWKLRHGIQPRNVYNLGLDLIIFSGASGRRMEVKPG